MPTVGAFTIDRIEDLALREGHDLFPDCVSSAVEAEERWLAPRFYHAPTQAFVLPIQSWLVRRPGLIMLIDTGAGNSKERPLYHRYAGLRTGYIESLAVHGVKPDDVDVVVCTHLDVDHVGWNTRLVDGRWSPTFARARYLLPRRDYIFQDPEQDGARFPAGHQAIFIDSVRPIVEAGQAELVDGGETVAPGVTLVPLPGHSPGQVGVRLASADQEALCIADVMHNPIQVVHPSWNTRFCKDPATARSIRSAVLAEAAERDVLLLGGHFAGRITAGADGSYAFTPVDL